MTGFETAVSAYIAEHGDIDAKAFAELAELYKTEGVADIKAAIKLKMGGAGNDKLDKALAKMQVSASDSSVKQLISRTDAYFESRIEDIKGQCQSKGLGKDSDIAKEYAASAAKAKSELSSAIKQIAGKFADLNPSDQKTFYKLLSSTSAVNEGDVNHIREIAATLKIQLAATKAYQEANKKVKSMITVAADAAKKAGQAVSDAAKKGYDTAKAGATKAVNSARSAAGSALEKLAFKLSDSADKIKDVKESTFNDVVADYVSENGAISNEVYNALRDICDSL